MDTARRVPRGRGCSRSGLSSGHGEEILCHRHPQVTYRQGHPQGPYQRPDSMNASPRADTCRARDCTDHSTGPRSCAPPRPRLFSSFPRHREARVLGWWAQALGWEAERHCIPSLSPLGTASGSTTGVPQGRC